MTIEKCYKRCVVCRLCDSFKKVVTSLSHQQNTLSCSSLHTLAHRRQVSEVMLFSESLQLGIRVFWCESIEIVSHRTINNNQMLITVVWGCQITVWSPFSVVLAGDDASPTKEPPLPAAAAAAAVAAVPWWVFLMCWFIELLLVKIRSQ